jgi:hypothetical protein
MTGILEDYFIHMILRQRVLSPFEKCGDIFEVQTTMHISPIAG